MFQYRRQRVGKAKAIRQHVFEALRAEFVVEIFAAKQYLAEEAGKPVMVQAMIPILICLCFL